MKSLWFIRTLKLYLSYFEAEKILRRYLVLGAFDGLLVSLSIIIASSISDSLSSLNLTVLAGVISIVLASLWSTLSVEINELRVTYRKLEKQLLRPLKGTVFERAFIITSIIATLTHSLSPLVGLLLLIVFNLTKGLLFTIILSSLILFSLGLLYGENLRENLLSGALMISFGLISSSIVIILGGHI